MLIKSIDDFVLATIVSMRQKQQGNRGYKKPRE